MVTVINGYHLPIYPRSYLTYIYHVGIRARKYNHSTHTHTHSAGFVRLFSSHNKKKFPKYINQVGFLDKKLRIVSKYCETKEDWLKWSKIAFQSSYGYEWQGDSLLIARENLLYTFSNFLGAI